METPHGLNKKRKTMIGGTLESPIGVINSMRRSSVNIITSTPLVLQTNDDEAERRNWKRMSTLPQEPEPIRVAASIPLNTLEEFMGIWVRMSVENKINTKNVWKIHIIEYLRLLLDKKIENPLQLATASLSASAKVYGLRVDDVYTDVIKLAGELGRRGGNDEIDDEHAANDNDNNQDNENLSEQPNPKAKKKKKTKKTKILATNTETLLGDLDLLDADHPLFAELNARSGDIIGTDNMFQMFIPINNKSNEFDIRVNEIFFDKTAPRREDATAMNEVNVNNFILPFQLQSPDAIKDLQICASFAEFSLTNWSPENEEQSLNNQQNQSFIQPSTSDQINLAFDMNEEPQAILDVSMASVGDNLRNYSSDEEIIQEINTEQNQPIPSAGCKPHIENIVDMRPLDPNTTRNLEYSYNTIVTGIWAGPAHWKIKSIIHKSQPRITTQQTTEASKRKRKTNLSTGDLTYCDMTIDEITLIEKSFLKCSDNKLKLASITSWNKNKNKLPLDLHITVAESMKLFLNTRSLVPEERPASHLSIENNQYDYNNLNDSAFCNPPNPELVEEEHIGSDHEFGDGDMNHDDMFTSMEHGAEHLEEGEGDILTGDNLLSAPRTIPKIFVPYATRAKKVNMKLIKSVMWSVITNESNACPNSKENVNNLNQIEDDTQNETIDTQFSTVIEKLPALLPRDQAANISPALAFFGLLHLANENTLKLTGNNDLTDITITKG